MGVGKEVSESKREDICYTQHRHTEKREKKEEKKDEPEEEEDMGFGLFD